VSLSAAEASEQECLDQLQSKAVADHSAAQTEHIHVGVLDALMRGESVVDQPGANGGDLVRRDARADAAAADRYPRSISPDATDLVRGMTKSG
jgi:hypothetical protein